MLYVENKSNESFPEYDKIRNPIERFSMPKMSFGTEHENQIRNAIGDKRYWTLSQFVPWSEIAISYLYIGMKTNTSDTVDNLKAICCWIIELQKFDSLWTWMLVNIGRRRWIIHKPLVRVCHRSAMEPFWISLACCNGSPIVWILGNNLKHANCESSQRFLCPIERDARGHHKLYSIQWIRLVFFSSLCYTRV